ncbi:hypothetical protein [Deinococcus hopiensis]|uniref:hypothetical protein n=1 Tax=Deinococcus hopiensis TaxID=309885 RepID=UPI00111C47AD|nr:hypothetical protein [Deinococcus hopiensis]
MTEDLLLQGEDAGIRLILDPCHVRRAPVQRLLRHNHTSILHAEHPAFSEAEPVHHFRSSGRDIFQRTQDWPVPVGHALDLNTIWTRTSKIFWASSSSVACQP